MDKLNKNSQSPGHKPSNISSDTPSKKPSEERINSKLAWLRQNRDTILGWLMIGGGVASLFFFRGVLRNLIEVLPHLFMFVLGLFLIYFGLRVLRFTKLTNAISKKASEYKRKYFGD